MSLMGIDIGTSACKALVFGCSGEVLAEAALEYTPTFPAPSRVEIHPEVFWRVVGTAVRSVASQVATDPVEALAVSSHGETFVPVDGQGEPVGPAILNSDNRATAEAEWWVGQLGYERIFEITGSAAHPAYPMAKIQWLRIHEPDLFAAAARFISVTDYILLKLGLPPYIDYSLASRFMAFDVRAKRWSEEILSAAGLSPDHLPLPVPAGTVAGRLTPTAAADLGVQPGTLVAVGGHDQPCAALGVGAVAPGIVSDSIGTFECLAAVGDRPSLDATSLSAALNSYCHVLPEKYITIAFFPSGMMVKWCCDMLCAQDAADTATRGQDLHSYLESKAPQGPTGLCITPHLIGSFNPHWDPRATSAILGLTPTSNRYQIYKGILEGLACELALNTEVLSKVAGPFEAIRVTGGGSRSRLGLQLRAAMTGRRLQTLRNQEAVCLGAAILAGVAAGTYASFAEAVEKVVQVTDTIEPDANWVSAYARQRQQYNLLYPALAPVRQA